MIRKTEHSIAMRAGIFSVLVHGLLLGILIISVNWKAVQPMSVAEVELWDKLPAEPAKPQPVPQVKPEPKIEPKPEPKPDPKPAEEPKADIQVKKLPPKIEKPVEKPKDKPLPKEQPKPDLAKKELEKKKQEEVLKKLQQEMLAEDSKPQQEAHKQQGSPGPVPSLASKGEIDKYVSLISSKIRQNVNKELCGSGNPELQFSISLIVTGEVIGNPKLVKSSGMPICDAAVERAILLSQPLPVPQQPDLFSQFRELRLKFRPNDGN